ncbi:MAG: esterase [Pseudoalteromonas tetraodonis]|jgi:esterase
MQLYFQSYPESLRGSPPVIIVPGLFGSSSNWRSFARSLGDHFDVYVVDQRNHGRSPHAASQSYQDMAQDLMEFIEFHGIDQAMLCGHSMGGKTAMVFSLLHSERVAKLAVLDIAPVAYSHSHAPFLRELLKIDLQRLGSRAEADRALKQAIADSATRLFLLQNLSGSPLNYKWRINLRVLFDYMSEIIGFPSDELAKLSTEIPCQFISGGLSDYMQPAYQQVAKEYFPKSDFIKIAQAGHWLQIEQPKAVFKALLEFLNK